MNTISRNLRDFTWAAVAVGILCPALSLAAKAPEQDLQKSAAPSPSASLKNDGEIGAYTSTGTFTGKLVVGKIDPPAAFNLEDIQNFPEERLQPVLNNPINFEEGRDFSSIMNFQDERMMHPWIPDFPRAPFLTMRGDVDSNARDWKFSIIDQAAGAVWTQQGKGAPPANLSWNGDDNTRGYVAVDTVYIPQVSITNKEGYHRTYPGQPAQFSAIRYNDKGRNVIELSSKALFQDRKAEFTKEGELLLEKVTDIIREEGKLPFSIKPYDTNPELARARQRTIVKFMKDKLYIADSQVLSAGVEDPEKRGIAFAIVLGATATGETNP